MQQQTAVHGVAAGYQPASPAYDAAEAKAYRLASYIPVQMPRKYLVAAKPHGEAVNAGVLNNDGVSKRLWQMRSG